jgi:hypothetical protein
VPTVSRTLRFVSSPIATIGLMWVAVLILAVSGGARAATSFNAQSAMGINLAAVNYFASEQPLDYPF